MAAEERSLCCGHRHPWKAENLEVECQSEELDDYLQKLVDRDEFCNCCGVLDDTGACPCSDWDDDCWVDTARPWNTPVHGLAPAKLTAKGKRLRAECRDEMFHLLNALDRRAGIRKARRRWMLLKDTVDAKKVALYWQEQTQQSLCAPEGAGRAADAAAFQAEL